VVIAFYFNPPSPGGYAATLSQRERSSIAGVACDALAERRG
jgi:hypothetical protein